MIRVVAGSSKGRKLRTLKGISLRPTSGKVRGAIFNILGDAVINSSVLDLFSGSGALGIEALSRGAGNVTFVDNDTRFIKENLKNCGFSGNVIMGDTYKAIKRLEKNSFNLVFADPPYRRNLARNLLQELYRNSILKNFSFVVIEHSKNDVISGTKDWEKVQEKKYGDTIVSIYRLCKR